MCNNGECVGHLELVLEDIEGNNIPFHDHTDAHSAWTVSPPNGWWQNKLNQILLTHHATPWNEVSKLNLQALLKEYAYLNLLKDETSIGTTPLTEMTIDTGTSERVSQKQYPISYETLPMGEGRTRENTYS